MSVVGNLKIEDRFELISHLFRYRSPDLNYEFATFSEVSLPGLVEKVKVFVKQSDTNGFTEHRIGFRFEII